MKLGILVNTDKHLDAISGLSRSALSKGHEVIIFVMDEGTRLLENTSFTDLCKLQGINMSFCDHSAMGLGVSKSGLTDDVVCGSQYNNSVMHHEADKVIVL